MSSAQRMCAFCSKHADPLAQEHLWSAWIGRLFPGHVLHWTIADPENVGTITSGKTAALNLKVQAVCGECNHGWMSRLETQVQPLLSRIIKDGESMYFSKKDLNKLAAFLFKNSVVANALNPAREPFFARAARERFKTNYKIPLGVSMYFGGLSVPVLTGINFGFVVGFDTRGKNRLLEDLEAYCYTFAIGYLVLQLRAFRFANLANRAQTLPGILPQPPFWDDYSIQFWPNEGVTLKWPPAKYIDEELLGIYTYRWTGDVRFR